MSKKRKRSLLGPTICAIVRRFGGKHKWPAYDAEFQGVFCDWCGRKQAANRRTKKETPAQPDGSIAAAGPSESI